MSKNFKNDISKCSSQIIDNVIRNDYVDAEKYTKQAVATNIAGRITNKCSEIRKSERQNRI